MHFSRRVHTFFYFTDKQNTANQQCVKKEKYVFESTKLTVINPQRFLGNSHGLFIRRENVTDSQYGARESRF